MQFKLINPINKNYTPLEQVLTNRGIQLQDIPHYLNLTEEDNLSPLLLKNIDNAIKMLIKHLLAEDNEIVVVVDCDCDGYTSSALLLNYIYHVFPTTISKIKYALHNDKTHGIIEAAITDKTTLVVVPDASSNEYSLHQTLAERGIDVLVIDHHEADRVSEYACVVNNQLCDYPNKTLSGVGVVYKVCQYLDSVLGETHANDFLDLVCVGLVGDMVDTRSMETKYLIQEGMRDWRNPYLVAMKEKNDFSLKGKLTPIGIAFYIVPFINAMTRSGTIEEKTLLFESMLEWKANEQIPSTKRGCKGQYAPLVEEATRVCTNVKNRQTREQDTAVEQLETLIEEQGLAEEKIMLIKVEGMTLNRNISGLMANKIMAKYMRPVGVLSRTTYNDKPAWAGSARGFPRMGIEDFREFVRSSGLVAMAEGHANAFGLTIYEEDFDAFVEWYREKLADIKVEVTYDVDFLEHGSTLRPQIILDLGERKDLWGQEVSEPLIAVQNLNVTKDMLILMSRDKSPTIKIQLPNGISCIKFKSSEEEFNNLLSEGCTTLNIVGRPEINNWCGNKYPQLLIIDYEIISKQDFYF